MLASVLALRLTRRPARAVDERVPSAAPVRRALNWVVADRWSFALGEAAVYCLVVLVVTGLYLSFFFDPSEVHVVYRGTYRPLDGVPMTKAYESTLQLSMDVRAGLLVRQIHHWAALLFLAVLVLHLTHKFFTGSFRKPRDLNWVLGVALFVVSMLEGFTGYTLPDDVLSGASLQIARSVVQSIPVVGTWLMFLICGGEFPGTHLITRIYVAHVLLIPALLFGLLAVHLLLVVRQGHAQPWSPDAREDRIVGVRAFPVYATRAAARFCAVSGLLALLGGAAQINPIWQYGPYEPSAVQGNSQSDWYFMWLEGALRLWMPWEFRGLGHTIPAVFFPGVVLPILIFTLTAAYPFMERRFTRDRGRHHVLQRARDTPVRAAIGAAGLAFWADLLLITMDDMASRFFHVPVEWFVWTGRVLTVVGPAMAFAVTYSICRQLGRRPAGVSPDHPQRFVRSRDGDYEPAEASPPPPPPPVTAGARPG